MIKRILVGSICLCTYAFTPQIDVPFYPLLPIHISIMAACSVSSSTSLRNLVSVLSAFSFALAVGLWELAELAAAAALEPPFLGFVHNVYPKNVWPRMKLKKYRSNARKSLEEGNHDWKNTSEQA